jgi:hypothetical protein
MARAGTKFKFADYDGGLKSHPIPAPSGHSPAVGR